MLRQRWFVAVAMLAVGTASWNALPGDEPKAKDAAPAKSEPTKVDESDDDAEAAAKEKGAKDEKT